MSLISRTLILVILISSISFISLSQDRNTKKGNALLSKVSSQGKNENLSSILVDGKEGLLETQIDKLLKELQKINKDFETNFSNSVDVLLKENKNYLDQLENEYRSKLKDEHQKISELKKSVDDILKIKDLELRIVDRKIDEINKNLKNLSSDEFIKTFKKELKKELENFKKSTIESFEEQLNIKVDTTKN
tara:strand:+ start:505 stop:1077 length:573 start_codon:yes stop_codon:yes gene_type:complete